MATQNFINECKNMANANRLGRITLDYPLEYFYKKNLLKKEGFSTPLTEEGYWDTAPNTTPLTDGWCRIDKDNSSGTGSAWTNNFLGKASIDYEPNTDYTIIFEWRNASNVAGCNLSQASSSPNAFQTDASVNVSTSSGIAKLLVKTKSPLPNNYYGIRNFFTTAAGKIMSVEVKATIIKGNYVNTSSTYNQSNNLVSMEFKDSCYVDNNIIGGLFTSSAEVELLNLPPNTELVSKTMTPEVGVKYANDSTEYVTFDDYTIESVDDKQTGSNTKFTAMNGGTLLDKEYECSLSFENGQTHTINEFYQDACSQIGLTPTDTTFDNSEIVMTGNPFTNKETIRTIISEVEKTSCSIARIDWKNKTISLTWLSDQIDYEFNTSDYSTLEGSLTQYGPLNVIIVANSQLNGENVVMTDQESVDEYGEHQIIIDSPYFLYTEELRTQAIQAIYNKLDGLTYYDLKLTTPYGKPFLNIGDKIRINTNENQVLDTYVLSHTFKFDGTFSSVIESPALTQEEQTVKNEFKGNSVREKLRRTELIVDKTTGDITAITDRVTTVENEFGDVYSKEEVNTLVQNSATGITNTFVNSGGNNLLRNTGLWFEDRSEIEYMYPRTTGLYPSDELFMSADPHWEYWKGNAKKVKEDKASNLSGILLQTGYLEQTQQVRNGTYTLSFKYRKLIELATVNVQINDRYLDLTNIEDTEIIEVGEITAQTFNIKIFSDTDDSCVIYDLMLNAGSEKAEYSQHQNETTTDTVNISKGITIQSSDTNTTFKANSDGIRVYNSRDMDTPITEYTDTGMDTNRIKVKEEAEIVKVLWKNVGNNTWISRL